MGFSIFETLACCGCWTSKSSNLPARSAVKRGKSRVSCSSSANAAHSIGKSTPKVGKLDSGIRDCKDAECRREFQEVRRIGVERVDEDSRHVAKSEDAANLALATQQKEAKLQLKEAIRLEKAATSRNEQGEFDCAVWLLQSALKHIERSEKLPMDSIQRSICISLKERIVAGLQNVESRGLSSYSHPPPTMPPRGGRFVPISDGPVLDALKESLGTCQEWLGQGRDMKQRTSFKYRLQLSRAWQVDSPALWQKYVAERCKMLEDLASRGMQPSRMSFSEPLAAAAPALGTLKPAVAETFLFHGTSPQVLLSIVEHGLNERLCGRAAFGCGTYLCDDAGKADQYVKSVDDDEDRAALEELYGNDDDMKRRLFHVVVCRTAIGCAVRTLDSYTSLDGNDVWTAAHGRSARRELADIAHVCPKLAYHSCVVEVSGHELFAQLGHKRVYRYREIVMPHSERIYPAYIIAYERKPVS
eukprot:TRINITY_DN51153_c0_g1_i1.p1 TRINITY_DN51153_c0_g1~~TRINITY_DN51153_c0_g1_i1.p1  ORF type:complete len:473 (+),score=56.12 TRINITY_DN51153_c0_g1_i1:46-1464(+)